MGVEKLVRYIFGNMIALGRLLRLIDIDIAHMELEKCFPEPMSKRI